MKILVADSGSTKCDWMLGTDLDKPLLIESMGFNPFYHNSDLIASKITEAFVGQSLHDIDYVYYYGAGCSTDELKQIVLKGLVSVFPNAKVMVSHDLDGAAIATCGNQAGIACILGTGSNACLWDGHSVVEHPCKFGLGFILGDEGSGSHIGKQLLKGYFYNDMPSSLREAFEAKYPDSKLIIHNTYAPGGNTYVAGFAKFAGEHKNEPYIQNLIKGVFEYYVKSHILKYEMHKEIPVNFVGSIAYLYQDILRELSLIYQFKIGKIIKQPIDALYAFHLAQRAS